VKRDHSDKKISAFQEFHIISFYVIGAPRLCASRTIGARGIKTWRAFGAPSHFQSEMRCWCAIS